jgi:putative intracellular protease/amidase
MKRKGSVLILVGTDYEEMDVWYPKYRLEAAGYDTPLAGIGDQKHTGKWGYPCPEDGHVREFMSDTLAGIVAPGGGHRTSSGATRRFWPGSGRSARPVVWWPRSAADRGS